MKAELNASKMEVWMLLPSIAVVYDPEVKTLEAGIYFLNFSLTFKTSNK
jgi:hypothetical protein